MGGFRFNRVRRGRAGFLSPCVPAARVPALSHLYERRLVPTSCATTIAAPGRSGKAASSPRSCFILGFSLVFIALGARRRPSGGPFRQALRAGAAGRPPSSSPWAHFLSISGSALLDRQMP